MKIKNTSPAKKAYRKPTLEVGKLQPFDIITASKGEGDYENEGEWDEVPVY